MSQLLIIGDKNPEIGKETKYIISLVNFGGLSNNISVFNPISEIPQWQIFVLEHGKWRKTSENTKQGESVSYTFKQSSISREGIKIVVTKGNDKGELIIKTKRAGQPKILKVDLLDVNYNKVTKPLHYFDTLIAKAQCTDMEGEKLHFTLWEDDALKEGHNKINEINKINPIPISATVKRGKAEARFNMAFYTQASMIANMQLAKGDKSEGKNHEYYVTADYYGKLEASNNINIANPDFSNPIQNAIDLKYPDKKPQKPKVNKRPTPPLPEPKKDTYKAPITPKAKTKAPDPKGKIISVEFVDFLGKPYQNMKFGTQVKAKILSKDMKGKTIKLKIWEDDISDQLVYENNYVLAGDESYATINLTNEMRKKGDDFKEGSEQEYFLEIEYAGQSVDSEVINVNDSAPKIKVETGVSTSGVKAKKVDQKKEEKVCECEARVRAFMRMLRVGEGTEKESGYSIIVGGSSFKDHGKDFSDHPKVYIKKYDSTAAGAYQITKTNWNDYAFVNWRKEHKIFDFSPESQDKYCVYLIKEKKKALELIKNNDIKGAINKCRTEWASLPGAGYGQREEKIDNIVEKYKQYYQEELKGPTNHLHIKNGFLKEFGESCCEDLQINQDKINKYKIDIDKYTYPKIMENKNSKTYQYDIYNNNKLIKSFTLKKNEHDLLPFPESGDNWGRFGTRDKGGDNWVNEKVCGALLGFFYSLPYNSYNAKLYFNDISANDGRNIGHAGHNISGNDVDIRYPGSTNGGQTLWRDAMKTYGTEEKFVVVLENILSVGLKWGFNKNYAYKNTIKHTTGKATAVHQDHFHLGLR